MTITVEIKGSVPRLPQRDLIAFTRKVLLELEKMGRLPREIGEVSIAFVDDEAMRKLNHQFRRKNKPTDVLTFPGEDAFLGDIVIGIDQAKRQATEQKHALAVEVRYLVLHGVLHALGFDHETDTGEMNALELELRPRIGLS